MTRIKIVLWAALFTAMLVSCGDPLHVPEGDLPLIKENEFYAQNMKTGKFYIVGADPLYEGSNCVVWAERGSGITRDKAKEIADEYDNKIRPTVVDTFSKKNFDIKVKEEGTETRHFDDMLDFANWLAYRDDKKLTILLLDILDGYPETDTSFVAGYFWLGNFYPKGKVRGKYYSNGRDMIYIDTNPGLKKKPTEDTYATFAHELQHLINFVTTVLTRSEETTDGTYYYYMDTWIDEGLSSQAEYLYLGENPPDKYTWFINDKEGTIARGNNFFVWDNHPEKSRAILDEYATVYLFFRWLYLQAAAAGLKSNIFLDIETSTFDNYSAVTDVAKKINPAWDNWETLLRTWLAANYYPKSGYGYTGDAELQTIRVKPIEGKTIRLYPGEGVYSEIESPFSPAGTSGSNIRYAGFTETTINTSLPYTGEVLLTFNANTNNNNKAPREIGYLTGVSPADSPTAARSIQTETLSGPYVIDARDMLERYRR